MPGIKEAKGFFYSLLVIGTLVMIASLYSTVWASPSQGVSGQTIPTPDPTQAANDAIAQAAAQAAAVSAEATAAASDPVSVPAPSEGAVAAFAPGSITTLSSPDGKVTVGISSLAPPGSFFLLYKPEAVADVPAPPPAGLAFGTTFFDLSVVDLAGVPAPNTSFLNPITLSVKYTDADVQAAEGNPGRLVLYKYDPSFGTWTALTTSVDIASKTVQAGVTRLSFFALMGGAQPPTPTPTPTATLLPGAATSVPPTATLLPPTPGDVAPGSGFLMGLLISAFILIAAGGYYLRQTKQS